MKVTISLFSIQNYRSCRNATLKLRPGLSTFIGVNGSGKTNILNAMFLLRKVSYLDRFSFLQPLVKEEKESNRSTIKATFLVGGKEVRYRAEIRYTTRESNQEDVIFAVEQWDTTGIAGGKAWFAYPSFFMRQGIHWNFKEHYQILPPFVPKELRNRKVASALLAVGKFFDNINYYSASQFTNPSECPASFEMENEVLRESNTGANEHRKFMFDLYSMYKKDPSRFQEFKSIVGRDGIGLIDDIRFDRIQISSNEVKVNVGGSFTKKTLKRELVVPHFILGRKNLSPSQLSQGTYKTLGLLLYLGRDKSHLLLLEEPEVCTHHGLLASIVEMLKSYYYPF
jgi:AAA15 family ATPase/GTPase